MFDAIKRGNKEPKKLKGGVCAIERIKEKKTLRRFVAIKRRNKEPNFF
jgi:hypothetical protein